MHYAKTYFSFHNILFFNLHTCIVMILMIWNLFIFIMSCAQYIISREWRNDIKKITLCISNIIINFPFVIFRSMSIVVTYSSAKEFNRVIEYALCAVTAEWMAEGNCECITAHGDSSGWTVLCLPNRMLGHGNGGGSGTPRAVVYGWRRAPQELQHHLLFN